MSFGDMPSNYYTGEFDPEDDDWEIEGIDDRGDDDEWNDPLCHSDFSGYFDDYGPNAMYPPDFDEWYEPWLHPTWRDRLTQWKNRFKHALRRCRETCPDCHRPVWLGKHTDCIPF